MLSACKPSDSLLVSITQYRILDWIAIVALIVTYVAVYSTAPHHSKIIDNDAALMYDLLDETVPTAALIVIVVPVPLALISAYFFLHRAQHNILKQAHSAFITFFLTVLTTLIVTDSIKKFTGVPRPNFIAMIAVRPDSVEPWQAFISGHSSLSFASMTFVSLFFYHHLSYLSPYYRHSQRALRRLSTSPLPQANFIPMLFLVVLPMLAAVFIALTRVTDYWHRPVDIVGGALCGYIIALAVFEATYNGMRFTWMTAKDALNESEPDAQGPAPYRSPIAVTERLNNELTSVVDYDASDSRLL